MCPSRRATADLERWAAGHPTPVEPSQPTLGPIPKLLDLRTRPLKLDTLLIAHGQPLHALAPLLRCVNPVHFGAFACGTYTQSIPPHKPSVELDWQLYASFGRKVWSRLARWSYGPVGRYDRKSPSALSFAGIASSPFRLPGEMCQAGVYVDQVDEDTEDVLQMFRVFCPLLASGISITVVVIDEWDRVAMEQLRDRMLADTRSDSDVREWWARLVVQVGERERAIGGRTVWPAGLLEGG